MQYEEVIQKRTFILRLEHGEVVHDTIENFAREKHIKSAALLILGGIDRGSRLVVGPEDGEARPVTPMVRELDNVREVCGVGTIFPDENGNPMLHMHMATGREDSTVTGCIRAGVKTWHILEVVIFELESKNARRELNKELGFKLLEIFGG